MQVDIGVFSLIFFFNLFYYILECFMDVLVFFGFFDIFFIDVLVILVVYCLLLQVNLSMFFLCCCFFNIYIVDYCNIGMVFVGNVYVEIIFDFFLELEGVFILFEELSLGWYKFDVENLDIGQCGCFNMIVLVSCEAEFG